MNLYDATVPIFTKLLSQMDRWLVKATEFATQKKFDPETLLQARLAPDQYPLLRQIQSACDQAKYTVAKLTGKEPPSHPDTEKTIAEVRARLKTMIDYLATFTRDDFNGAEERRVSHTWMGERGMRGGDYLDQYALVNFHFHYTTGYSILRHNGVGLGKIDVIGPVTFI
ncbi:MAG: DUF1993 family protein [Kofleriaceae bacterium]